MSFEKIDPVEADTQELTSTNNEAADWNEPTEWDDLTDWDDPFFCLRIAAWRLRNHRSCTLSLTNLWTDGDSPYRPNSPGLFPEMAHLYLEAPDGFTYAPALLQCITVPNFESLCFKTTTMGPPRGNIWNGTEMQKWKTQCGFSLTFFDMGLPSADSARFKSASARIQTPFPQWHSVPRPLSMTLPGT